MKMCRGGARIIAMAFAASLSNTMCSSVRAADLLPILQGGGYYNWSGYYVGGNLGAGVGRTTFTAVSPGLSTTTSDEIRGFVGGVQGGFNWQNGPLVAGIEADLQFSHERNGVTVFGMEFQNTLNYFSTLRGRVGYALDEWLFYATAGGGFAGNQDRYIFPLLGSFADTDTFPLWVVGAGVETEIWDRWTGRLEYLYLQSGSFSDALAIPGGTLTVTKNVHDHVIRTGLNYHF
jgi:outer membrane immunogenic protein